MTVLDANHVMCRLLIQNEVDPIRFKEVIDNKIEAILKDGRPLRFYGDIVDSLTELGYSKATVDLENLLHDLLERNPAMQPIYLECGYMLENFKSAQAREYFDRICSLHDVVLGENATKKICHQHT